MNSENEGKFIYRIPLDWYCKTTTLAPKTAVLAVALWYLQGYKDALSELKLTGHILKKFHISRHTAYRALEELKEAGLINYTHRPGAAPKVMILFDHDQWQKAKRSRTKY